MNNLNYQHFIHNETQLVKSKPNKIITHQKKTSALVGACSLDFITILRPL